MKNGDGGEGERVEIKDESVLVQRGRFRFVPNKGIKPQGEIISEQWGHSPTTPSARQLGPVRKRRPLTAALAPKVTAQAKATGGWPVAEEEVQERERCASYRFSAVTETLQFSSFPMDSSL